MLEHDGVAQVDGQEDTVLAWVGVVPRAALDAHARLVAPRGRLAHPDIEDVVADPDPLQRVVDGRGHHHRRVNDDDVYDPVVIGVCRAVDAVVAELRRRDGEVGVR